MPHLPPPTINRIFTVDQANAALPLVRAIMADILRLERTVRHLSFRLRFIKRGGDELTFMFDSEIRGLETELASAEEELERHTRELLELGIEPEGLPLGLIDFPMNHHGTTVYLCWRYGESRIRYWHTLTGGFVDRQPLKQLPHLPGMELASAAGDFAC